MINPSLDNKLILFFSKNRQTKLPKGSVIIHGDDEPTGVYLINKGFVKMSSINEDGSEIAVSIFKPNSFFPMTWAVADIENKYFYKALTDVELYKSNKHDFLAFLSSNTDILFDLTSRLLTGLDGIIQLTKNLLKTSSTKRVASLIKMLIKRFGVKNEAGETIIDIALTQQDISNFIGTSRETASIAIEKLKKQKIIDVKHKKIIVLDIDKLNEI